jgi:hypothetical protein
MSPSTANRTAAPHTHRSGQPAEVRIASRDYGHTRELDSDLDPGRPLFLVLR